MCTWEELEEARAVWADLPEMRGFQSFLLGTGDDLSRGTARP